MSRDLSAVDDKLVASVRSHTERVDEAEIRAALAPLSRPEQDRLERLLRNPPTVKLGPFGWADVARGTPAEVASAREVSGYYTLLAERDALAALVPEARLRRQKRAAGAERAQHLLGLFAYHRDAPLVARALRVSLETLDAELSSLGIRAKAYRLARGSAAQMPRAAAVVAPSGPPVRRRSRRAAPASPPPPGDPMPLDGEAAMLRAVLAEVGPRRAALAERLGTSGGALLARFRAAGLERELALRERDLIRALWSRNRGSEAKVAAELGIAPVELREVLVERGLSRELEAQRDRLRREALRRRWPRERIEQVLDRRDELRELGILEGLEREVSVRAGVIWNSLRGKRDALDLFAKKLRLSRADAVRLQKLLHLS
jgi:hypothetical protein